MTRVFPLFHSAIRLLMFSPSFTAERTSKLMNGRSLMYLSQENW